MASKQGILRCFERTTPTGVERWEIRIHATQYAYLEGVVGEEADGATVAFDHPESALAEAEEAIASHLAEGFVEVDAAALLSVVILEEVDEEDAEDDTWDALEPDDGLGDEDGTDEDGTDEDELNGARGSEVDPVNAGDPVDDGDALDASDSVDEESDDEAGVTPLRLVP